MSLCKIKSWLKYCIIVLNDSIRYLVSFRRYSPYIYRIFLFRLAWMTQKVVFISNLCCAIHNSTKNRMPGSLSLFYLKTFVTVAKLGSSVDNFVLNEFAYRVVMSIENTLTNFEVGLGAFKDIEDAFTIQLLTF